MSDEVDIVVTGFDVDARQAEAGLVRLFGIDGVDARRFLQELPTIAKRGAPSATARRYVEALQSIGARVDCVPSRPQSNPTRALASAPVSLPAPPSSMMQELHRAMRVEEATEEAIDRFRESEGLPSRPPTGRPAAPDQLISLGPDPMNPRIPQAPRLPNLTGMPNARPSRHDSLPALRPPSGDLDLEGSGERTFKSLSPEVADEDDFFDPGAGSSVPRARRLPLSRQRKSSGATPITPHVVGPSYDSIRAMQRVGKAQRADKERRTRTRVIAVLAAIALGTGVLAWLGRSDDAIASARKRMHAAGLEPGHIEAAAAWLGGGNHGVHGLDTARALELVSALQRAGAASVHVVRVEGDAAAALVVELPREPPRRRTVLWHIARFQGREPSLEDDTGQQFMELLGDGADSGSPNGAGQDAD